MPAFCLLADPRTYRPCPINMREDIAFREHWIEHFGTHFDLVMRLAIEQYGPAAAQRAQACKDDMLQELAAIRAQPTRWGELDLMVLEVLRQHKLRVHGLPDPFQNTKARENAAMLAQYPALVAELDGHAVDSPQRQLLLLVEGVFAGNIFDLGTAATAQRYADESPDFIHVRDSLEGKRPWLVDHLDAWSARLLDAPGGVGGYRKAVLFLDNAGSDFLLGVLPLARWLARRQVRVVLAANMLPALNDVTITELPGLLQQAAAVDPVLADQLAAGLITAVDSGGIAPLIDLRHISDALNAAAADADLVILEGMGRAVGSNFDAQFSVDSVKICMVKDPIIAGRLGGRTFDTVLRFDPGGRR
jgi:type II pantothenate kinase